MAAFPRGESGMTFDSLNVAVLLPSVREAIGQRRQSRAGGD